MLPKIGWLTVNRFCNFRCPWCYAESTKYSSDLNMSFELAKELVDLFANIGVKTVIIIGGEPTYYKHFFDITSYVKSKNMKSILVTNGYRFKDKKFIDDAVYAGLNCISFSLKAGNREQYKKLVGVDAYDKIIQSLVNLSEIKSMDIGYSITVTKDNIANIEEMASLAAMGKRHVGFSFCTTTFDENKTPDLSYMPNPQEIVRVFVEKYESINNITNGKFSIAQTLPNCIWPKDFTEKLKKNNHFNMGCHVMQRNGLIFDYDGSVILCNCLSEFPIGKYGIDFNTRETFEKYWLAENIVDIHNQLIFYPSNKCVECSDYSICGGGCPLKWFVLSPAKVIGE